MRIRSPFPYLPLVLSYLLITASGDSVQAALISGSLTNGTTLPLAGGGNSFGAGPQDLTALGSIDWAVWGTGNNTSLAPVQSKLGGTAISNLTNIGASPLRGLGQFPIDVPNELNWTNGTPSSTGSNVPAGLQHNGFNTVGQGFGFDVSADQLERVLNIYVGVFSGTGTLTASLSDGSAAPFSNSGLSAPNQQNTYGIYSIRYASNSPGQTLHVEWILTSQVGNFSNVDIAGATVSSAHVVPEPSTFAVLGLMLGITGLCWYGRRRGEQATCGVSSV